ncbi:hypothetical protein K4043_13630 [Stenotrophomonas sp. SRS1]|uniref:hypothetical protein n=1 Tax=Stenotrophomonas sp. SRS1 TaxID=2870345 RepID=UPI002238EB69|nr:hypothetical protein [Stenotrophomonas sp. SRS1]MCW6029050.1 hypothetical protein [Stenotrophomonas sp. SRS1]
MIYLIHYERNAGKIVEISEFKERDLASEAKLAMEIRLLSKSNGDEVVLLEARDKNDLLRTHSRYFENLSDIKIEK